MNILIRSRDVYSQLWYNEGVLKQKFNIKIFLSSKLTEQGPSRIPLNYQEKLNTLLDQLC